MSRRLGLRAPGQPRLWRRDLSEGRARATGRELVRPAELRLVAAGAEASESRSTRSDPLPRPLVSVHGAAAVRVTFS